MEGTTRPNFDDKNETVSDPLHAATVHGTDGDSRPLDAPLPESAYPTPSLTLEEAAVASKALFEPTLRRMGILVNTLIQVSENGDLALWATLGCLDQVLRGLDWASVSPDRARRFYTLIQLTLSNYAMRLDGYVQGLADRAPGTPLPDLPAWAGEDTLKMYDLVDAMYPATTGGEK